MKKYELINKEEKCLCGRDITMYQIRALVDIPEHHVMFGDIGGWIEKEENLSHEGDCWINTTGYVFDNAQVSENAVVGQYQWSWEEEIPEDAYVFGNAQVKGDSVVWGPARVTNNCVIDGYTHVVGEVCGHAHITGEAAVYGFVGGRAIIKGNSVIFEDATVYGETVVDNKRLKSGVFVK